MNTPIGTANNGTAGVIAQAKRSPEAQSLKAILVMATLPSTPIRAPLAAALRVLDPLEKERSGNR
jgi:hypothetical protein